jgi:PAS domain S-box-containing protein
MREFSMNLNNKKILVVEDEYITAADLIGTLENMGFTVPDSTDTGEEVFNLASIHSPDLILMDINLKGRMNGIKAAEEVRKTLDIPIIFLTGQSDEATIVQAIESEPYGYIIKPFEERTLKTTISMALYKHGLDMLMRANEERYRMISESSDNLILIVNPDFSIDYINTTGAKMFLGSPAEFTGEKLSYLLDSEVFSRISALIRTVMTGSQSWRDKIAIHHNNRKIWLDLSIIFLADSSPVANQVLLMGRDITFWMQVHNELEREGIVRLEKNMEQFQILNDQIRNPLTMILSYATMDEYIHRDKIIEAVRKIDDLVTQLDKGWIESEKVRSFLIRHYHHGLRIE